MTKAKKTTGSTTKTTTAITPTKKTLVGTAAITKAAAKVTTPARRAIAGLEGLELPGANWDIPKLTAFATGNLADSEGAMAKVVEFRKKSCRSYYAAGAAFAAIRDKLKGKGWGDWRKEAGISVQKANDCIAFFERVNEQHLDVSTLTLVQAKKAVLLLTEDGRRAPLSGGEPAPKKTPPAKPDTKQLPPAEPSTAFQKPEAAPDGNGKAQQPPVQQTAAQTPPQDHPAAPAGLPQPYINAEYKVIVPRLDVDALRIMLKQMNGLATAMDNGRIAVPPEDVETARGLASELADAAISIRDGLAPAIRKVVGRDDLHAARPSGRDGSDHPGHGPEGDTQTATEAAGNPGTQEAGDVKAEADQQAEHGKVAAD